MNENFHTLHFQRGAWKQKKNLQGNTTNWRNILLLVRENILKCFCLRFSLIHCSAFLILILSQQTLAQNCEIFSPQLHHQKGSKICAHDAIETNNGKEKSLLHQRSQLKVAPLYVTRATSQVSRWDAHFNSIFKGFNFISVATYIKSLNRVFKL